eukprot:scaffold1790_cov257-Pinguiococcus_pyrenoidosus.AAC.34
MARSSASSRMNCGICVVFPHPVSPLTMMTWFLFKALRSWSLELALGSFARTARIAFPELDASHLSRFSSVLAFCRPGKVSKKASLWRGGTGRAPFPLRSFLGPFALPAACASCGPRG